MKENIKAKDINLFNVYHVKGKTVFYDFLSKNNYLITDKSAGVFQFYSMRFSISILFCFILMSFSKNYLRCIAISFFLLLLISFLFHKVFLKQLQIYHFNKTNTDSIFIKYVKSQSLLSLSLNCFCTLLAGTSVLVNTIELKAIGSNLINYSISFVFYLISIFLLISVFLKKRYK